MTDFRDLADVQRYEQGFENADGRTALVFADYAVQGDRRVILHVEAEPALRGSGAAGRFMQSLADHARGHGHRLQPRCGYAVAWFRRHPDAAQGVVSDSPAP